MALDLAQFHDGFFEESYEALDTMEAALLKLNSGSADKDQINTIFRVAHSIKGGSATFGFTEIASFTHTLETLFDELRSGKMQVTRSISDLLLKSVDVMREMLRAVQHKEPVDAQRVADLQFDLELVIAQKAGEVASSDAVATAATDAGNTHGNVHAQHCWRIDFRPLPHLFAHGNDPLRMVRELADLGQLETVADLSHIPPLTTLDPESCYLSWQLSLTSEVTEEVVAQVFDWAEGDCELTISDLREAPVVQTVSKPVVEAVSSKVSAVISEPRPAHAAPAVAEAEAVRPGNGGDLSSIRVSIEKIDELMNAVGELVITQSMLSQLGTRVEGAMGGKLRTGLVQLERNVRELQESVMRVRMLPISFVFSRFPRMVRDLSHRLGKQVELKVAGDQTELDKTVLEKIGDPLTHLVRNCIDHGIEQPEVRIAAGKPALGTVFLNAYHKGGSIVVEVGDDGAGLSRERILQRRAQEI